MKKVTPKARSDLHRLSLSGNISKEEYLQDLNTVPNEMIAVGISMKKQSKNPLCEGHKDTMNFECYLP